MTDDERKASLERVADILLLSLETLAENFAMIVAGEKRLAVVPRKVPDRKVNNGIIYELRMTTPPPPAALREQPVVQPVELGDLIDSLGTDAAAAVIPDDDPENHIDHDVGDSCCEGGPWWGHDENCPQAVDPAVEFAERKGLPLEPVDPRSDELAQSSFGHWSQADRERYRK